MGALHQPAPTALTGSKRPPEGCLGALEAGACASVDAYQRSSDQTCDKQPGAGLRHGDYSSADARRARARALGAQGEVHTPRAARGRRRMR